MGKKLEIHNGHVIEAMTLLFIAGADLADTLYENFEVNKNSPVDALLFKAQLKSVYEDTLTAISKVVTPSTSKLLKDAKNGSKLMRQLQTMAMVCVKSYHRENNTGNEEQLQEMAKSIVEKMRGDK